MILANAVDKFKSGTPHAAVLLNRAIETIVLLLTPITPHLCEELAEKMGYKESIAKANWPFYSEEALVQDTVTIVAQVNGKVRGEFVVAVNAVEADLRPLILSDARVKTYVDGKEIKKFIVIPNKLVSIVV